MLQFAKNFAEAVNSHRTGLVDVYKSGAQFGVTSSYLLLEKGGLLIGNLEAQCTTRHYASNVVTKILEHLM